MSEALSARLPALGRRWGGRLVVAAFVAILFVVFFYPVGMIVFGSLHEGLPDQAGGLSVDGIVRAYTSAETYETVRNSLVLVIVGTVVATVVGGFFAWLATSTNTPGRRLLFPMMIVMLLLPPLFYGFGWIMLANRQNGLLNTWIASVFGAQSSPIDVQSWGGLLFTTAIGYVPFAFLLMIGAFQNRDQSLDEASQISGAGLFSTFFRVTIPSIGPTITGVAALLIVLIFQSFDIPQLLGRPAGIFVFSTEMYHYIYDFSPAEYSSAFSLALAMLVVVILLFLTQRRLLRGRSFTTLSGKGFRRQPQILGPIRFVFTAAIVLFALINLVLPLGAVVVGSMQPIFGVGTSLSFNNYVRVLEDPGLSQSLSLTAELAVIGGLVAMTVALITSYVVLRRSGFLRTYTSLAVWVPWALPGIVIALAYLWAILTLPGLGSLYGSAGLMLVVLIVATIPLVSRVAEGALAQLSPELEEAARIAGSSPIRVLVGIVLRLVIPSFLAGWFLSALFISGNLAVPAILAAPGVTPVSIAAYQLYISGDASAGAALYVMVIAAAAAVLLIVGAVRLLLGILRRRPLSGIPRTTSPSPSPSPSLEQRPASTTA